ncbi:hypothetical protein LWC05_03230 [Acetobacter sicerae]|uniref:Uncharacterized protein n=1 Tax=Acetobacter sicerae TaxID=85325 RepID=A0ABS8VS52_9PROT|nr:hypothetical protein [Acetobacter sicerae]MCE0742904.1 hypothetical protein [Acetobacter sicerae]
MTEIRYADRVDLPPRPSNAVYGGHAPWNGEAHQVAVYAAECDLGTGHWTHRTIPDEWTVAGRFLLSHSERKALKLPERISAIVVCVGPLLSRHGAGGNVDWFGLPAEADCIWHEAAVPHGAHREALR